jgi:hypothetical protein
VDAFWASLELTPEQRQMMDAMRRELGQKYDRLHADMQAQHDRLFQLMEADPLDEQAVAECQARIEGAQQELRHVVIQQIIATRRLLTPRQREQWAEKFRGFDPAAGHRSFRMRHSPWMPQDNRPEPGESRSLPGVLKARSLEVGKQV